MPAPPAAMPPPPSASGGSSGGASGDNPFAEDDPPRFCAEDGQDIRRHWAQSHWIHLDGPTGRLLCPSLGLAATSLTGRIVESRVVRAFIGVTGDCGDTDTAPLCASVNGLVADFGRPGRECASCEEWNAFCTPHRQIVWEGCWEGEPSFGSVFAPTRFAHVLSAADTVAFTRYRLALRRAGLQPDEVLTRLTVKERHLPGAGVSRWHIRFEKIGD